MKEKRMKVITHIIGLILTGVLFLNGPCYEIVEAHTSKMCRTIEAQETISQRGEDVAGAGEASLVAVSSEDIGEMVLDDSRKNRSRVSYSPIHIPGASGIVENMPLISKWVTDEQFCGQSRRAKGIIEYLHRTDGEK